MHELSTLGFGVPQQPTPVRVTRFIFFETGTYDDQYRRPYTTNFEENHLEVFQEYLHNASRYTPQAFAGYIHQFLTPQMNPEGNQSVYVPNSWSERRARFMIEFEYETARGGMNMREIVTGYTENAEFHDVNGMLSVDPRLVFFVNNTTKIRNRLETSVFGQQQYMAMADNSQVLVGQTSFTGSPDYADNMYRDGYRQHYMRPTDVLANLQVEQVRGYGEVYDSRTTSSQSVKKSQRGNAVAANYMARVIDSMNRGRIDEATGNAKEGNVYQGAQDHAKEQAVASDHILRLFADARGTGITNTFTWSELMQLAPNAADVCQHRVSPMGVTRIGGLYERGSETPWNGVDYNTQQATILSHAIPGLMSDLLITRLKFQLNNYSINGQPLFNPQICLFFSEGFDGRRYLELFEQRFLDYVVMEMSQQNLLTYNIEADVDLAGETIITLSIEGQPTEQFVTPTFADSLFTPVITGSAEHFDHVADQMRNMMNGVLPSHEDQGQEAPLQHKRRKF